MFLSVSLQHTYMNAGKLVHQAPKSHNTNSALF